MWSRTLFPPHMTFTPLLPLAMGASSPPRCCESLHLVILWPCLICGHLGLPVQIFSLADNNEITAPAVEITLSCHEKLGTLYLTLEIWSAAVLIHPFSCNLYFSTVSWVLDTRSIDFSGSLVELWPASGDVKWHIYIYTWRCSTTARRLSLTSHSSEDPFFPFEIHHSCPSQLASILCLTAF